MRIILFIILCLSAHATELYRVAPSGSMKPLFDERYVLFVDKMPWKDIQVGQVILYRTRTAFKFDGIEYDLICHTVLRKSSNGGVVICKGEANATPDCELITESMYVGTVIRWMTWEQFFDDTAGHKS